MGETFLLLCLTGLESFNKKKEIVEADLIVGVEVEGWVPLGVRRRQAYGFGEAEKIAETDAAVAVEISGFGIW